MLSIQLTHPHLVKITLMLSGSPIEPTQPIENSHLKETNETNLQSEPNDQSEPKDTSGSTQVNTDGLGEGELGDAELGGENEINYDMNEFELGGEEGHN